MKKSSRDARREESISMKRRTVVQRDRRVICLQCRGECSSLLRDAGSHISFSSTLRSPLRRASDWTFSRFICRDLQDEESHGGIDSNATRTEMKFKSGLQVNTQDCRD